MGATGAEEGGRGVFCDGGRHTIILRPASCLALFEKVGRLVKLNPEPTSQRTHL